MTTQTVTASDVQRQFGRIHDMAMKEPVAITNHGRSTSYLVSADLFEQMLLCYRRASFVGDLSDGDMRQILEAKVPDEHNWEPDELSFAP